MGSKPSKEVGTKMAQEYAYDIIELGMTASQASIKRGCSTQKVVSYIRRYLDKKTVDKFEKIMAFNRLNHPYMQRKRQTNSTVGKLKKLLKEGIPVHKALNEFYKQNCIDLEPRGAIRLAQRAGINENIAEKEYKKFREELRRI